MGVLCVTECVEGDEAEFAVWCYGGGLEEALDILGMLMCILGEAGRRGKTYLEICAVGVVTC